MASEYCVQVPASSSKVLEIHLKSAKQNAQTKEFLKEGIGKIKPKEPPLSPRSYFSVTKTFSGLYCLLIISVYITITANKLSSSPMHHPEMEVSAMMTYLYLISCLFLLYLLFHLAHPPNSHANIRSHGSAFLRQGALVFGLGSFTYHVLEFITYFIIDLHPNCLDVLHTINSFFSILFVVLQMITIILYPRLNIHHGRGVPHFGLMHLLSTNLIVWMRTVIKESIHEYHVAAEKLEETVGHILQTVNESDITKHLKHDTHEEVTHNIHKRYTADSDYTEVEKCKDMYHDDDFVSDVLKASSPFLYAFIIEFSLVGGTVFFNTWNNVSLVNWNEAKDKLPDPTVQKPNLCGTLAKINWSKSSIGVIFGIFIMFLTVFDLIIFFSVNYEEDIIFEYIGKILNCFVNTCGILASLIGIIKIQTLLEKSKTSDNSVDLFLLDLGIFFVYVYSCLTIIVGVFTANDSMPGSVHISNGVLDILACSLQVILIHQLLDRTIQSGNTRLEGRQIVAFLCFLNFSVWLFDTFELQKSKASLVEAEFYGYLVWVWMQRITLPICIFFRFHSTALLVDCWKNSYRAETISQLIMNINHMKI